MVWTQCIKEDENISPESDAMRCVNFSCSVKANSPIHYPTQSLLTTPKAPRKAPITPITTVGQTPAGTDAGRGAPLKGLYDDVADGFDPPVPPPVKLAPLAPIGRELSVNAHELDVQMHCPAMGSQKGVEQFVGKRKRAWEPSAADCDGLGLAGVGGSDGHPYYENDKTHQYTIRNFTHQSHLRKYRMGSPRMGNGSKDLPHSGAYRCRSSCCYRLVVLST